MTKNQKDYTLSIMRESMKGIPIKITIIIVLLLLININSSPENPLEFSMALGGGILLYSLISSLWFFIKHLGNYIVGIALYILTLFALSYCFEKYQESPLGILTAIIAIIILFGGLATDLISIIKYLIVLFTPTVD